MDLVFLSARTGVFFKKHIAFIIPTITVNTHWHPLSQKKINDFSTFLTRFANDYVHYSTIPKAWKYVDFTDFSNLLDIQAVFSIK